MITKTKICAKCNELKEILHKNLCSSCYYKARWEANPEKARLKNRKHYYKKRGHPVEEMSPDQFQKQNAPKTRKERNFLRFYRLLLATPKWLSQQDVYDLMAKPCPKGMSKDHIIPLHHPNVCGLNVPWNIQYLTMEENNFKKCKFDGTKENNSWRAEYEEWKRKQTE